MAVCFIIAAFKAVRKTIISVGTVECVHNFIDNYVGMGKSSFPVITIANKTVVAFCFCNVPNLAKLPKNLHVYI